jgi:hypothetical protein
MQLLVLSLKLFIGLTERTLLLQNPRTQDFADAFCLCMYDIGLAGVDNHT